jgi:UDP-N-acetylmuramoyl-tripeptide--D-alanyl-D-alanine ligase
MQLDHPYPFAHRALLALRSRLARGADAAAKWLRRVVVYPHAWLNRRRRHKTVFIGITGSAGKTTTKDLSHAILSLVGPCARSWNSANEHFDVAQTVANVRQDHRHCVVELSAAAPGYLDFSLRLARPDIAVLTLVARDHFSAFKSAEAIAAEKGKIVAALPPHGVAVLNIDDPLVREIGARCTRRIIWVGRAQGATLRLRAAASRWPEPLTLHVENDGVAHEVRTSLHGEQLALAVLASLGVAVAAGVPLAQAIAALQAATGAEGRMQPVRCSDGVTFMRDDWKAPLWSLAAPFAFLGQAVAARKVVIIGTLSDYSLSASKVYPKVARQALEIADIVVFVGPHAMRALKALPAPPGRQLLGFPAIRDASEALKTLLQPGDLVLLKGSNKADHLVRLILDRERPIACWRERCGRATFCGRCGELHRGTAPTSSTSAAAPPETRHPPPAANAGHAAAAGDAPWVVIGIGNRGAHRANTPHNVGHRVLDLLADEARARWTQQPEGWVSTIELDGRPVHLLKPDTDVNDCGAPVSRFLQRHGGSNDTCVVVHDDMDLEIGDVRRKLSGGDAGHKGVRSLIAALGSGEFERVRVGVRRAGETRRARELVLNRFAAHEQTIVDDAVRRAAAFVLDRQPHARPGARVV